MRALFVHTVQDYISKLGKSNGTGQYQPPEFLKWPTINKTVVVVFFVCDLLHNFCLIS